MLIDNSLYASVENAVPNFNATELTLNNFSIYYKPYAKWTAFCQATYATTDI
jgi:hypothetical protein